MTLPVSFQQSYPVKPQVRKKENKYLPLQAGVLSAAFWTGAGIAADKLILNKIFKSSQKDNKFSLIFNTIFGLIMGVGTYINVRKKQKEENVQSFEDLSNNLLKA